MTGNNILLVERPTKSRNSSVLDMSPLTDWLADIPDF